MKILPVLLLLLLNAVSCTEGRIKPAANEMPKSFLMTDDFRLAPVLQNGKQFSVTKNSKSMKTLLRDKFGASKVKSWIFETASSDGKYFAVRDLPSKQLLIINSSSLNIDFELNLPKPIYPKIPKNLARLSGEIRVRYSIMGISPDNHYIVLVGYANIHTREVYSKPNSKVDKTPTLRTATCWVVDLKQKKIFKFWNGKCSCAPVSHSPWISNDQFAYLSSNDSIFQPTRKVLIYDCRTNKSEVVLKSSSSWGLVYGLSNKRLIGDELDHYRSYMLYAIHNGKYTKQLL